MASSIPQVARRGHYAPWEVGNWRGHQAPPIPRSLPTQLRTVLDKASGEVASLLGRPVSAAQAMELLTVIALFFGVQIEGAACPAWPGGPKLAAARGAVQASSCPGPWLMARLAWREGVQAENSDNHMS